MCLIFLFSICSHILMYRWLCLPDHHFSNQCDLPYIFPSSDKMIFLLPQGGYMASASWKLCSISGLQTPSASLSIGLSAESLILSMSSAGLSLPLQLLGSMVMAGLSKPQPGCFKRIDLKGKKIVQVEIPASFLSLIMSLSSISNQYNRSRSYNDNNQKNKKWRKKKNQLNSTITGPGCKWPACSFSVSTS